MLVTGLHKFNIYFLRTPCKFSTLKAHWLKFLILATQDEWLPGGARRGSNLRFQAMTTWQCATTTPGGM